MSKRPLTSFVVFLSLAILVLVSISSAQVSFNKEQYSIKHKKFVLKNGLTLLVHEDKSVPIVGVNMWYHVGSRNEARGKTGFAHLFEHFFFNGSENHPFGFREAMDDLGANNRNGTTNTDRTNFFEDVPTSALERTLFLEADRMGFLEGFISKEMLERERGVVQNEKRQGENSPYGKVFTEIAGKVYPYSHPYSWPTIGSMDDLNAATLDDIKEWYQTYYGPNNAVISLAGDISPEKAYELVNKYFGDIPPGPPLPRMEKWIPKLDSNMRDEMEDRVPQARIYRVYQAPAWKDDETQYLNLLADVLSGSKSSRLNRSLVYGKKLATGVSAGMLERELGGLFLITVTVNPDADPADAEREVDAVVNEVLTKGVTAEELKRFQNRNLSGFLRGSERLGGFGGRSDILAESQTYGGSPDAYVMSLETMANATPAIVQAAGKKWLSGNHYTMVVNPAAKLTPEKTAVNRKNVPELGAAPSIAFPEIQKTKLKNGLSVMLLERHSTPIVNITLAVDAGSASTTFEKAGAASLALNLMEEGTATRDAFQISDQLDMLGASLSTGNSLDLSVVRLRATSEKLQPSLGIMADVVLNPAFPEDQFLIEKKQRLAQIAQEKANANAMAFRVMPTIIYSADHAYGKPDSGFVKSVENISRQDLSNWHEQWFKPGSSTIVVAGDITMATLLPMLEQAFGTWKSGTAPKKQLTTVPKTQGKRIYLIDKPGAPQSTIMAAHITSPSGQAEDLASEPLFRNFGGMSTSRLNRNLRLDKHWSYGAQGGLRESRGQQVFYVISAVQTDKTKESMVEVIKEIRNVAGEKPVTGEEFESIMRNMSSRLPGRFETLAALEGAAIDQVNLGLADDYWANYGANVRKLTEAQLSAAAKKFVQPDDLVWIVVGDLSKIEKGISELNYGQIIKLDSDGNRIP